MRIDYNRMLRQKQIELDEVTRKLDYAALYIGAIASELRGVKVLLRNDPFGVRTLLRTALDERDSLRAAARTHDTKRKNAYFAGKGKRKR